MHRTTRASIARWTSAPGLVTTTWALALVLVGPLLASAPSVAEPPAARDGAVASASQAPTRLRVVNHNIEKRAKVLERALKVARRTNAQVITLQEVCWWQAADLREQHPEWTISYIPERNRDRCANRGHSGDRLGLRHKVGNLAIWTGGPTGQTSTIAYGPQRVRSDNAGLACVSWLAVVRHRACSAHLIAPQSGADVKVRTAQAKDIRRITSPWIKNDDMVVLGGDFNADPSRRTMRWLYKRGGKGQFREAAELRTGGRQCQCARSTFDSRPVKIDYVFYSANRTGARAQRKLRLVRTASDHHLLVGWADVDAAVH